MDWLGEGASGWSAVRIVVIAVFTAWLCSGVLIPNLIHHEFSKQVTTTSAEKISEESLPILSFKVQLAAVTAELSEEFFFRYIPLGIAVWLFGRKRKWLVIAIALLSSASFGFLHGGYDRVILDGLVGFSLCLVFLKCGGLQREYDKGVWYSFLAHFLLNWINFALAIILKGARYITFPS